MEVLLKKSKITNSILTQTLEASFSDIKKFKTLGFCVFNKRRYIILYNEDTNELRKFPMIRDVIKSPGNQESLIVKTIFGHNYIPRIFKCEDKEGVEKVMQTFKDIKRHAIANGQIFL